MIKNVFKINIAFKIKLKKKKKKGRKKWLSSSWSELVFI